MRTTLTLDDDIGQQLADLSRESHQSFKFVVNMVLRRGLSEQLAGESTFRVEPHAGHLKPGIDDRNLNELAWELDEERFRKRTDDPE